MVFCYACYVPSGKSQLMAVHSMTHELKSKSWILSIIRVLLHYYADEMKLKLLRLFCYHKGSWVRTIHGVWTKISQTTSVLVGSKKKTRKRLIVITCFTIELYVETKPFNKLEILFHWNRCVAGHCIETCIPSLKWFGPTVTNLCFGHGNPDAAAADESNPCMLPFQATQNHVEGLF